MTTAIASQIEYSTTTMETTINQIQEEMSGVVQELESKLPSIQEELENIKAMQGLPPPSHSAWDRAMVKEDPLFTLRQYLDDDQSILSRSSGRCTPSMQLSSLGDTSSLFTSKYYSAHTHPPSDLNTIGQFSRGMTLYVRAMGKTLPLKVTPEMDIPQVKALAERALNLPDIELDLIYEGRQLTGEKAAASELIMTVKSAGLPDCGRLSCDVKHRRFSQLPDDEYENIISHLPARNPKPAAQPPPEIKAFLDSRTRHIKETLPDLDENPFTESLQQWKDLGHHPFIETLRKQTGLESDALNEVVQNYLTHQFVSALITQHQETHLTSV